MISGRMQCRELGVAVLLLLAGHAAAEDALERVTAVGGIVRRVSAAGDELDVDFGLAEGPIEDRHLQDVTRLPRVVALRCKGTAITDAGLESIARLDSLRELHLEQTVIGDEGLRRIESLKNLVSLNLYGTRVTDAGLARLAELPRLQRLNVARSAVTAAGVDALREKRPELRITPDLRQAQLRDQEALRRIQGLIAAAETAHRQAEQEVAELAPQSEKLRKEAEDLRRKFEELKTPLEQAKKKQEDTSRRAAEFAKRAEEADRQAAKTPADEDAAKTARDRRAEADAAAAAARQAKQDQETLKADYDSRSAVWEVARKLADRASNAKKSLEDAEAILRGWREREAALQSPATP